MRKRNSGKTMLFTLMLVLTLAVTACGSGNNEAAEPSATAKTDAAATTAPTAAPAAEDGLYNIADFSNVKTNQVKPLKAAHSTLALYLTLPLKEL